MGITFGEKLKNLRTEANLSQQQLADLMYVNRSSVANWESGRRVPDLVILSRLARILGVDASVLSNSADIDEFSPEVIIVDDESILLQGAIPILSNAIPSATITGFTKSSEALEYARKNRIAIAFLDIELGRTSGLELCDALIDDSPDYGALLFISRNKLTKKVGKLPVEADISLPGHLIQSKEISLDIPYHVVDICKSCICENMIKITVNLVISICLLLHKSTYRVYPVCLC
ncbi:MAG: helix-turn-helix domain-containing protein [Butyrivibrio sp.]|nr:helix-turn-helix domain-containing protein [Butyrivibrio sp.]